MACKYCGCKCSDIDNIRYKIVGETLFSEETKTIDLSAAISLKSALKELEIWLEWAQRLDFNPYNITKDSFNYIKYGEKKRIFIVTVEE